MTPDELKHIITGVDPDDFCRHLLFDLDCWLFENSDLDEISSSYLDFRSTIGNVIDVDEQDIRLVGSTKYGVSMSPNPDKLFRPFNDESDLDVLIVSEKLFIEIWNEFRNAYYNGYGWVKKRHSGDIFRRFLYLVGGDQYQTTYLRDASKRMDGLAREVLLRTGLSRPLKYRIYASWDDAVGYHSHGVRKLQRVINNVA